MYPYIRFFSQIMRDSLKPKIDIGTPIKQKHYVLPNDLDFNIHMNSGRYMVMADLGRMCLVTRSGALRLCMKHKWSPVYGGCLIRFNKSLQPFQKYYLLTQLISWDEKWFYGDQRFVDEKGKLYCLLISRTTFVHKKKIIPPEDVLKKLGNSPVKENVDEYLQQWKEMDNAFLERKKDTSKQSLDYYEAA